MAVPPAPFRAIFLDFADTLYPFRVSETNQFLRSLHDFLQRRLAQPLNYNLFIVLYDEVRTRQFTDHRATLREHDFTARICEVVEFCRSGLTEEKP